MRAAWSAVVVALLVLTSGCATTPTPPSTQLIKPAEFPDAFYEQAAKRGDAVYRVEPAASLATVYTYRAGALARVGHDHVIASHDIQGYVLLTRDSGQADLYIPLNALTVDEAALRAEAGFNTQPTDTDIAGTRNNMLRTLETDKHPFMLVHVAQLDKADAGPMLNASITLHGVAKAMRIPVEFKSSDNEINVSGRVTFRQTDFGIAPYSVFGGALQVKDEVELRFRIHARRLQR
jgi:polyisoprenoid-binding protein YceI